MIEWEDYLDKKLKFMIEIYSWKHETFDTKKGNRTTKVIEA